MNLSSPYHILEQTAVHPQNLVKKINQNVPEYHSGISQSPPTSDKLYSPLEYTLKEYTLKKQEHSLFTTSLETHSSDVSSEIKEELTDNTNLIVADKSYFFQGSVSIDIPEDSEYKTCLQNESKKIKKLSAAKSPNTDPTSCKTTKLQTKKRPWKTWEDAELVNLIDKHGRCWSKIAKYLGNRTGKQVRNRYLNYLEPNLNLGEFTPEENQILMALHAEYGNRWVLIAKHLPGRGEGQIKNQVYCLKRNLHTLDSRETSKGSSMADERGSMLGRRRRTAKEDLSFYNKIHAKKEILMKEEDCSPLYLVKEEQGLKFEGNAQVDGLEEVYASVLKSIGDEIGSQSVIQAHKILCERKHAIEYFYAKTYKKLAELEDEDSVDSIKTDC